jgi:hypothetical protein
VVNELEDDYNGYGRPITHWQEHSRTVNTSGSAGVQYGWLDRFGGVIGQVRRTVS